MELAPVQVIHGTDRRDYNLGGKTVREAIALLNQEVYGGQLSGLTWLLNGERPEDVMGGSDATLTSGDKLTFLARGGDKGSLVEIRSTE